MDRIRSEENAVSVEDYALNLLLIAVVIRQIRGKKLTVVSLLWPVGLVALAAAKYLRTIPTAGNDLALALGGALVGAALGSLCGVFTRIHHLPDDSLLAKATGLAAALWIVGVGARMGFALFAEDGGGPAIGRFSADHHITGAAAWTACLILMALAEVVGRTGVLAVRSRFYVARPVTAGNG